MLKGLSPWKIKQQYQPDQDGLQNFINQSTCQTQHLIPNHLTSTPSQKKRIISEKKVVLRKNIEENACSTFLNSKQKKKQKQRERQVLGTFCHNKQKKKLFLSKRQKDLKVTEKIVLIHLNIRQNKKVAHSERGRKKTINQRCQTSDKNIKIRSDLKRIMLLLFLNNDVYNFQVQIINMNSMEYRLTLFCRLFFLLRIVEWFHKEQQVLFSILSLKQAQVGHHQEVGDVSYSFLDRNADFGIIFPSIGKLQEGQTILNSFKFQWFSYYFYCRWKQNQKKLFWDDCLKHQSIFFLYFPRLQKQFRIRIYRRRFGLICGNLRQCIGHYFSLRQKQCTRIHRCCYQVFQSNSRDFY